MKIRKQVKANSKVNNRNRKVVRASKSTSDMLAAFEDKLAEFGVEGCDRVTASADPAADDRAVEIYGEDYHEKYEDVGGGFDSDNSIITLAEVKEYWNENNMGDPVLAEYPNFDRWWADTKANFLVEA